jgi:signal transduction histidine kinase
MPPLKPEAGEKLKMRRSVRPDRLVLAGFAGLLVLTAALAIDSVMQIRDVGATSATLRKSSRDRDALLDELRTETYRSATLARDYLLEHDERDAARQKAEFLGLRPRIDQALDELLARAPESEKDAVLTLKSQTNSFWNSLAPAINWTGDARRINGQPFLWEVIVPRRDELVQLEKQIAALDARTLDAAEARLQSIQATFRSQVSTISIVALLFGGLFAAVVYSQVRRLGAEAASRFEEVCHAKDDLKRLSDRLVSIQEEERRNLSRELHDDLGQTMSAMLIELGKAEGVSHGGREALSAARRLAEENVAKIRNMALLLRPAMLDELGLASALRWHVREVGRRTGLNVRLIADDVDDNLPESHRTCVYRIVQEALNNCVKHAKANEARVVMRCERDGLSVFVQDDGIGFDPAKDKGVGLLGMMERVSALGGRFEIESQPGRGAVVAAWLSLDGVRAKPAEESIV